MIYAPHTFELTLNLNYKKYSEILDLAFVAAEMDHRIIKDPNDDNIHYDEALKKYGIRIMYVWGEYKKRIKLIVNPSKLLGGDDIPKLWKPNKANISEMLDRLEGHIDSYFDSEYSIDDFTLTRMDFTVNVKFDSRQTVSDYIKVLHNIGKVKGYSPIKNASWVKKDLAFVLVGNSNDITFWAYDKEGRERMFKESKSRLDAAKGILRLEIQLTTNSALLEYTDASSVKKQIKNLAKQSKVIFMDIFSRIMPRGDFYKKGKAGKLIAEELLLTEREKRRMLNLIDNVPKKKSLLLAQKELGSKYIKGVMSDFENMNICPVTISKRHGVKCLKSLYTYI